MQWYANIVLSYLNSYSIKLPTNSNTISFDPFIYLKRSKVFCCYKLSKIIVIRSRNTCGPIRRNLRRCGGCRKREPGGRILSVPRNFSLPICGCRIASEKVGNGSRRLDPNPFRITTARRRASSEPECQPSRKTNCVDGRPRPWLTGERTRTPTNKAPNLPLKIPIADREI